MNSRLSHTALEAAVAWDGTSGVELSVGEGDLELTFETTE
jgi:hypothetical protein